MLMAEPGPDPRSPLQLRVLSYTWDLQVMMLDLSSSYKAKP